MSSMEEEWLKSIDFKLGQMVALTKLANKEKVSQIKQKLVEDKEHAKILEICQQPTSFSDILNQVGTATGAAEATVKRRLAELRELGALTTSRQGKEVYYVDSGLFD